MTVKAVLPGPVLEVLHCEAVPRIGEAVVFGDGDASTYAVINVVWHREGERLEPYLVLDKWESVKIKLEAAGGKEDGAVFAREVVEA